MPISNELTWLDATALAEIIRRRDVSALEVTNAAIERIERLNPELNAVVTPMFEEARRVAGSELPDGPFKGVPFLLKDLTAAYAGFPMSFGSAYLREFIPNHDTELVVRHKKAGLVVLGKTNTPELGIMPTTEPLLFGATRNPWDLTRTPGGSSGGSAAAVAAGLVPMAHANDGGGSIRIPASCCGLFGLKPTRARNPLGPDYGDIFGGFVAEHAVTRSVRDSAALLDATSGPEPGDPYAAPPPARPFLNEVGADPGRLRIGLITKGITTGAAHPDCVAAAEDAARLCEDLGHHVEEASLASINGQMLTDAFMTVWAAGNAAMVDSLSYAIGRKHTPQELEPATNVLIEMGRRRSAPDYLIAVQMLQVFSRRVAALFENVDVLLTPTLGEPPLPLGSFDATPENPLAGMQRAVTFVPFTPLFNATGQPAMSVPLFWNDEGLPIGSHFVARFGDEATLFRLASQLETARPWKDRHPAVSV